MSQTTDTDETGTTGDETMDAVLTCLAGTTKLDGRDADTIVPILDNDKIIGKITRRYGSNGDEYESIVIYECDGGAITEYQNHVETLVYITDYETNCEMLEIAKNDESGEVNLDIIEDSYPVGS